MMATTPQRAFCAQQLDVRVECVAHTHWGDSVIMVGAADELGRWHPARGVALTTGHETYPHWQQTVRFWVQSHPIAYKFLIRRASGQIEWEPFDGNRSLLLRAGPGGSACTVACTFGEPPQATVQSTGNCKHASSMGPKRVSFSLTDTYAQPRPLLHSPWSTSQAVMATTSIRAQPRVQRKVRPRPPEVAPLEAAWPDGFVVTDLTKPLWPIASRDASWLSLPNQSPIACETPCEEHDRWLRGERSVVAAS